MGLKATRSWAVRTRWIAGVITLAACARHEPDAGGANRVQPVDWGSTRCSSCEMVVADRATAAQCTDAAGATRWFDDLGCLVIETEMGRLEPRGIFFRHRSEDRWLAASAAAFVLHEPTPMGFGYAAVDSGAGELSFEDVRAQMVEKFRLGKE